MSEFKNLSEVAKEYLGQLNKSFETGYNIGGLDQYNAAALRPQALDDELKRLTLSSDDFTILGIIPRKPARSTVEQYVLETDLGFDFNSGNVAEPDIAPVTDPSIHQGLARIKFLSITRQQTLAAGLVNNITDPMEELTRSGMLALGAVIENNIFYGDEDLTAGDAGTGKQFDGLAKLIDQDNNVIDKRGESLTEQDVNNAAATISVAFGKATDAFMPIGVQTDFANNQFSRQVTLMQTPEGFKSGFNITGFQSSRGPISFHGSNIMDRSKIYRELQTANFNTPAAPVAVTAAVAKGKGRFTDADVAAGTVTYHVHAYGAGGPSASVATTAVITDKDDAVTLKIDLGARGAVLPDFIEIGRNQLNDTAQFVIAKVPLNQATIDANNHVIITFVDVNDSIPGTADVFVGQISNQVLSLLELLPMARMAVPQSAATIAFTVLWYGALALYAPKKWVMIKNVKYNAGQTH